MAAVARRRGGAGGLAAGAGTSTRSAVMPTRGWMGPGRQAGAASASGLARQGSGDGVGRVDMVGGNGRLLKARRGEGDSTHGTAHSTHRTRTSEVPCVLCVVCCVLSLLAQPYRSVESPMSTKAVIVALIVALVLGIGAYLVLQP